VHLYGQTADMDAINAIAERHHLIVIEDACQAHGAMYKGRKAGTLGHAAAFSFYPAKNLGAYGDGGMAVTSDQLIADRVQKMRNYGQSEKYHHELLGYNHRLDTLQAAVLRVKLKNLDHWNTLRRNHATLYEELLSESGVVTPKVPIYSTPVWHLYVIRTQDRDGLAKYLSEQGISTGIHYPIPIHLQACYAQLGYKRGDFPVTEQYAGEILSLPMYPELSASQIKQVCDAVWAYTMHHHVPLLTAH
jgi:dTDP-4-amino-4,6-dideoxygalactose transaminase